jgi:alpha-L-rhamnosidase
VELPSDRAVKRAVFLISADNEFVFYLNANKRGQSGGGAGDFTRPAEIELTRAIHPGTNMLAIEATNTSREPNPAGLIGRLRVEFERGEPLSITIDRTWKSGREALKGWMTAQFDDSAWSNAREIAPLGGGPWGSMSGAGPTLSPVRADPFAGHVDLSADVDLAGRRVDLEMDTIFPEEAARVTVNGSDVGGFIGRPLRLDVTRVLHTGTNTIRIEPFAPKSARLLIEGR